MKNTLTYNGDQREMLGAVKGPNSLGEWFRVTSVEYKADEDKTKAEFTLLNPTEFAKHLESARDAIR